MYMAINEDEIVKNVMMGHAIPASQLSDPAELGYVADLKRLPYNPKMSKRLLKEAGYENGFEITLAGPNDRYIQDEKICEAVAKYLAKVGIKCNLDIKPKSLFFPEIRDRKHDFYLLGWYTGPFDMIIAYVKLLHTVDIEKGYGTWNGTQFSDPTLDTLIEASGNIVDQEKRKQVIEDMNKIGMAKIPAIPLHYQVNIYAIQKGKGIQFKPRPDRWIVFKEISRQ